MWDRWLLVQRVGLVGLVGLLGQSVTFTTHHVVHCHTCTPAHQCTKGYKLPWHERESVSWHHSQHSPVFISLITSLAT
jgi:hypothetical protein